MRLRRTFPAFLLGKIQQMLSALENWLALRASGSRQPVPIPVRAERRLRPGHPPGRYRRYD